MAQLIAEAHAFAVVSLFAKCNAMPARMEDKFMAEKPTNINTLKPGQVVGYARKSVTRGRDGTNKSISDQHDCNQETADFYGLPLTSENWMTEEKNHGGDEWWKKCPEIGLEWGAASDQPYRPTLTKLVHGVVKGQIKCVIVWSLDRLFRDVAIAKILIDVFGTNGCLIYDRNGSVPIDSPESRGNVLQTALAAQQYREMCAVNSPRGVKKLREREKIVVTANVLGFRHVTKGRIRVVMEEIELVRRIFVLFCGGMSKAAIARQLMDEGVVLAPDLYETRPIQRIEDTHHLIYNKQINTVLRDVRYIGKQPHEKQTWDCPAFLVDGEPAVEPVLFEKAQELLNRTRRTSNNVSPDNYLAGLIKCGLCGQYLTINPVKQNDGTIKKYWISKKHDIQTWCTHSLPNITEPALRDYTEQMLLPLLIAELDENRQALEGSDIVSEIAVLKTQIEEKTKAFRDCIKRQFREGGLSSLTASILEEEHKEEIGTLETRINELERIARERAALADDHANAESLIERWQTISDEEKRLAIHSVLRWVIVLPSQDFSARPKLRGGARSIDRKKDGAPPAGKVVYLTAWGTLHTAIIKRVSNPNTESWHKPLGLVSAQLGECIGSCADLPDPAGLAAGLERSYKGRGYKYHPSEVMPGYLCSTKIAEFDMD
jgi:DNA invertase Pin-like site-specific DNA recombinase